MLRIRPCAYGVNRNHPFSLLRGRDVDIFDITVRIPAAIKSHMQHIGKIDIVHVQRLPGQHAHIFIAFNPLAKVTS